VARYKQAYAGEHRTTAIGVKLTPAERKQLEAAATARGDGLSEYIRHRCFGRSAPAAGGASRNPEARALAYELSKIGNNLNQLARIANTNKALPHLYQLKMVTDLVKAALQRVIKL
jgi:Bacterial mobilisation protein (MobC)